MADKKFVIAIIELDEDELEKTACPMHELPDELYSAMAYVAAPEVLRVESVYLCTEDHIKALEPTIEKTSLMFPRAREPEPTEPRNNVFSLAAHRARQKKD